MSRPIDCTTVVTCLYDSMEVVLSVTCFVDRCHDYSAPDRGAEYYDERVCLSVFVCPRSYLRNYTSDIHHFSACNIWPWLGPRVAM